MKIYHIRKNKVIASLLCILLVIVSGCTASKTENAKNYVIVECPPTGVEGYFGIEAEGQTSVSFPQASDQDIVISYATLDNNLIVWKRNSPFIYCFDKSKNPASFGVVFFSDEYNDPISFNEFKNTYLE